LFLDKPYQLTLVIVLSLTAVLPLVVKIPILDRAEKAVARFATRRVLATTVLFLAVVAIRLALIPLLRVPVPGIHDEFSYLLMGDTFAHGRLTNPTHPMWISFETIHVNWIPTYCSKYPPAQGLVLAIGQLLGHPWIGVLLSNAAMCALIVWMLQAWVPPQWAFLGGVVASLQFAFASYWMNSYWGGAVAAVGGALVLGSLGILANSRPYEGLLLCLPVAVYLILWVAGKIPTKISLRERIRRVLIPLLGSMLLLVLFVAYYNYRLTGNPLLSPYVANSNMYLTGPMFLWQHSKPQLKYRNEQFEQYYSGWRKYYRTTIKDAYAVSNKKVDLMGPFFFWRAEWPLILMAPFLFRDRKMRFLVTILLVGMVGMFVVVWGSPHYAAPLLCVLVALLVQAMRHMNTIEIGGRPIGSMAVRIVVVLILIETGVNAAEHKCDIVDWMCQGQFDRAVVADELSAMPGKHLVVVRYYEGHDPAREWVYNRAEIDSAKIVWAREMDVAQNEKLFTYFRDRKVWLVRPDEYNFQPRLPRPYPFAQMIAAHQESTYQK
jgi:hypothetical protein